MKQILFPTAYTQQSKIAFRYAQELAKHFDAGITLVHIYESPTPTLAANPVLIDRIIGDLSEEHWRREMHKLKAFAHEMESRQYKDISLDFIVTDGNVRTELRLLQQKNDFDLVIMGMRRLKVSERLFGSTTDSMINEMDCPILLVPPDAHYMRIDKIIYGTAFDFGDVESIDFLLEWCRIFEAKLHLLHVQNGADDGQAFRKMNELMKNYSDENEAGTISFQLGSGKIASVIEEYIQFTSADILAIHRRKQGFWQRITEGSLTKVLAQEVMVPLLVLKN